MGSRQHTEAPVCGPPLRFCAQSPDRVDLMPAVQDVAPDAACVQLPGSTVGLCWRKHDLARRRTRDRGMFCMF